jgi:phosphoserine phosphatase
MPLTFDRRTSIGLLASLALVRAGSVRAETDPLPSWTDGSAKSAIISFVSRVTNENGSDFVPSAERVAVFDNDGTLWPEAPVPFQLAYALDALKDLSRHQQSVRKDPMVQAAIKGDFAKLLEGPRHEGLLRIVSLTHAGMTTEEFKRRVDAWISTARHPRFQEPYDRLTYQPMQEVMKYLRTNGFKTFIVSGGGADFMRAWSERVYGIPPRAGGRLDRPHQIRTWRCRPGSGENAGFSLCR